MTEPNDRLSDEAQHDERVDVSRGEEKVVITHGSRDEDPDIGETVHRKTLGGEMAHTVSGVVEVVQENGHVRRDVELEDGRTVQKSHLKEYTRKSEWKVVEMPDGREYYVEEIGPAQDGELVADGGSIPIQVGQYETIIHPDDTVADLFARIDNGAIGIGADTTVLCRPFSSGDRPSPPTEEDYIPFDLDGVGYGDKLELYRLPANERPAYPEALVTDGGEPSDEAQHEVDYDETLELTDEGIEMPEMLKGYVGEFKLHTASVDATLNTVESGYPDTEYFDGAIAMYPEDDGDVNTYLAPGYFGLHTDDHPEEKVFKVVDNRENTRLLSVCRDCDFVDATLVHEHPVEDPDDDPAFRHYDATGHNTGSFVPDSEVLDQQFETVHGDGDCDELRDDLWELCTGEEADGADEVEA